MGLLDSTSEEPVSKLRRYIVTGLIFALLIALGLWWIFRFYPEKRTVERFLDAVVANDMRKAYEIWKPTASYSYKDFVEDWGPSGYYGPIRSYHIETAQRKENASGVIVVVETSPFQPFPDDRDTAKQRRTREIRLWVEISDRSLSFPP